MRDARPIFEKIWSLHSIRELSKDTHLLAVDRCYLHDLNGGRVFESLREAKLAPYAAGQIIGVCDHTVSSAPERTVESTAPGRLKIPPFQSYCDESDIAFYGPDHPLQGIVHVIGPELGISLPGMTIVCGDSHTCTHGALGALAWGVGSSELRHAVATQTLVVEKPKTMNVRIEGEFASDRLDAMDIALALITRHGSDFGVGYAVEYSGSVVRRLDMEDRLTLCNLTVECGSEYGLISPDRKTFDFIRGGRFAPAGTSFDALAEHCAGLASSKTAVYDKEIVLDITDLEPQISWGISPAHSIPLSGRVPVSELELPQGDANLFKNAMEYMGLTPGQSLEGLAIQRVFIGSCANGRLSNLRRVAALVNGKTVAPHVEAWIVPGSRTVKRDAEAMGLDVIFTKAGFMWGSPGCSLCSGSSGEKVAPFHRCVSTSNRNFVGRQGPGARTHLAGPTTAALAALSGVISAAGRVGP